MRTFNCLNKEDKILFIKQVNKNPNIRDIDNEWFCHLYNIEHMIFEKLADILYKLNIEIDSECKCNSYFPYYWPDNLIAGYEKRCQK